MFLLLSILFIGLFFGFLLRKFEKMEKPLNSIIMISIYGLLFFIGINVGSNEVILKNLTKIGINAFILTIAAVAGSILVSIPVFKNFFNNKNNNQNN